jgi:protocatechuate 3,4-dioxygenase beta subunit
MRNLSEHDLTEAVEQRLRTTADPRMREIMTSLVRHLHDFVREVELTEAEWFEGIRFLTDTGHASGDKRQEFILLSDTLGVSMLVDAINHRHPEGATQSTVFGPFHREGAPALPAGANIAAATAGGEPTFVSGRVTDTTGRPLTGALLDVWQAAPNGLYDSQDPQQNGLNLRGKFHTDGEGRYSFQTVKPVNYPIPSDGPVGRMLRACGRHPYRPAHIHFIVSAAGHRPVTTHVFVEGDPYLDSDAVFAVKTSLITPFVKHTAPHKAAARNTTTPFYTVDYDFALTPA